MEEKKAWSKKKKIIVISVSVALVLIIAVAATVLVMANSKPKKQDTKETQSTTAKVQETTTIQETTTSQEVQTTASYISSAVNQFSTTAGPEWDSFYADSVFVGDSVMYGFERYIRARPGTLGDPFFLTAGSFAARIELAEITDESPNPIYNNQKVHISDALPLIGKDKVFLFFGLNDIGMVGVDQTVANYQTVINNIRAKDPDIKIYIISTTFMAAGSELKTLNNSNIRLLDEALAANAPAWGVGYVDVAKYMYDSQGCMVASYSSDGYVHITAAAYDLWVGILRDYASKN